MAEMPLRILETKLWLVARGRLGQALELDQVLQGDSTHIEQVLQDTTCHQEDTQSPYTTTCFDKEYIRQLQKEFWSHCVGSKSCPHCGAHSPKIRHDGFTKLFQAPLSATSARINAAEDIVLQSALGDENDNDEDNDDAGETLEHDSTTPAKITPKDKFLHTLEVEAQVHKTWQHHPALCQYIFGPAPTMFFIRAVPVPPNRFRPPMVLGNLTVENAQNLCFNQMLVLNDKIRTLLSQQQEQHDEDTTETQQQQQQRQALALSTWIELQTVVNRHFDSSKDPSGSSQSNGIRQLLEKKEGLFRKHFMGKRVDYACRSVISPDPYVGTNEIGIPQHFCQVLTFPTPVSDLTIQHLRNLVRRGPREYPGAVWVQYPDGRRVDLDKMDATQRGGLAARLRVGTIVGRQIHNGDVMLVNRQVRGAAVLRLLDRGLGRT
jgi:DNA-directed RNA polymerase I subunit RPA1